MTTGFIQTPLGLTITKDPMAVLTYTLDWAEWLEPGDSLATLDFTIQARANDPAPLVKQVADIAGTKTYITLSGGQVGKVYTVTAFITTAAGEQDRRNFKVNVMNRTA
jgi:hypothetical protein